MTKDIEDLMEKEDPEVLQRAKENKETITCPICGEGTLQEKVELLDIGVSRYSVCDTCGSEQTTARQSTLNVIEKFLEEKDYEELKEISSNLKRGSNAWTGWEQVIDDALVIRNIDVFDRNDTYEEAKRKLNEIIDWEVQVATDPRVNGGCELKYTGDGDE